MDKICLVQPFMEYGDEVLVDPSDLLIVEVGDSYGNQDFESHSQKEVTP